MLTISWPLASRIMATIVVVIIAAVMLPLDSPNNRAFRPISEANAV